MNSANETKIKTVFFIAFFLNFPVSLYLSIISRDANIKHCQFISLERAQPGMMKAKEKQPVR